MIREPLRDVIYRALAAGAGRRKAQDLVTPVRSPDGDNSFF